MQENFWEIIVFCNFSKNAALHDGKFSKWKDSISNFWKSHYSVTPTTQIMLTQHILINIQNDEVVMAK